MNQRDFDEEKQDKKIMKDQFNFTFETQSEYHNAERRGFIPEFNIVRLEVDYPDGYRVDYPVKSKEDYENELLVIVERGGHLVRVYQSVHSFDIQDYVE